MKRTNSLGHDPLEGEACIKNIFMNREPIPMGHDPLKEKMLLKKLKMKQLYGFHVILTTYNSRTSKRMQKLNISSGNSRHLNLEDEIALTKIFRDLIVKNNYKCIAYNICGDHVHLLVVCEKQNLVNIIQKLKSISSKLFNRLPLTQSYLRNADKRHLWSQKFYSAALDEFKLTSSNMGLNNNRNSHLFNTILYINRNRQKHNLTISSELESIITEFIMTIEQAYEM